MGKFRDRIKKEIEDSSARREARDDNMQDIRLSLRKNPWPPNLSAKEQKRLDEYHAKNDKLYEARKANYQAKRDKKS